MTNGNGLDLSNPDEREVVIRVRDLEVGFGPKTIMKNLSLDVYRGEILGFVGGSGQGKSVLTRTVLGLIPKRSGTIEVFGEDLDKLSPTARRAISSAGACCSSSAPCSRR
jgi:phospholipid/cholesterol/gamma-HCH transport system ATP-binding protein